jgi:hypothetical protein
MSGKWVGALINFALLPAFLFIFNFAGMQYCYWIHNGWCADLTPVSVFVGAGIAATFSYALVLAARRVCKLTIPSWKLSVPFLLAVLLTGVFFREGERRREAVWQAVYNKDIEGLRAGIGIWNGANTTGLLRRQSILDLSVERGFNEGAKFLLEQGADPNGMVDNCHPYHPLAHAHASNNEELYKLLKPLSAPLCPELKAIWMRDGNCGDIGCD